jgi:hypothetical protein
MPRWTAAFRPRTDRADRPPQDVFRPPPQARRSRFRACARQPLGHLGQSGKGQRRSGRLTCGPKVDHPSAALHHRPNRPRRDGFDWSGSSGIHLGDDIDQKCFFMQVVRAQRFANAAFRDWAVNFGSPAQAGRQAFSNDRIFARRTGPRNRIAISACMLLFWTAANAVSLAPHGAISPAMNFRAGWT